MNNKPYKYLCDTKSPGSIHKIILWKFRVNLKQIATQTLLAASSQKCTLKHSKSSKESLGGKY